MKSSKIKMFLLLLIAGLMFQACSDDDDFTTDSNFAENDAVDLRGGNGPNIHISQMKNDIVHDWTEVMLEVERYAAGMRPNGTARALAYVNLASYETAVPLMRNRKSMSRKYQDFKLQRRAPRRINPEIAINEAFARTLSHFLINVPENHKAKIEAFRIEKKAELSGGESSKVIQDSEKWGAYVAQQVIKFAQTDEEAEEQILEPQPLSYEPPVSDGYWTYSADPERALFPYWGSVRTFVISPNQTTTIAPLVYSEEENSEYFQQMLEVYTVNNTAKDEENDDLHIAEFWSDDAEGIMFSPPARQLAIANQLIKQFELDLEETLELYLKIGFSLNDAAVATWKYKYEYMVMRPNVFIHEFIDPDFQTNLFKIVYWPNPSFPGYPSGHSCFASAAAGIFKDFFGNEFEFTDRSHEGRSEFLSDPRTFSSMDEMAEENAFSRIPLGVHVRMDCTEGLRLGYEISDALNEFNLGN